MMFMGFFWLFFLIVIILAVVYFAQPSSRMHDRPTYFGPSEDPLEIAKLRYAKGEISKAQFEQIKKDLAN